MVDLLGGSLGKFLVDNSKEIEVLIDKDILCAEIYVIKRESRTRVLK